MEKDLLKKVIYDQHNVIRNFKIVDREYDFDINANYVVVGLRRAGKSTLLYKIVQNLISSGISWNQIIYINFEDERLSEFSLKDFNDVLAVQAEMSSQQGWFFFDEIQNIDGWEKFARRMADSKEHVFITGSNAKMLSGEIESKLGGRYFTKYVSTYNFREYLTARNIDYSESSIIGTKSSAAIKKEFETYFHFGGFPENLLYQNKREYISGVYQKVLLSDIANRNAVRNTNGLRLLVKKIAESVKDEISYSKLCNILKSIGISISKDAIIDYVNFAKQSYLIFTVKNFFSKFVEKETTPKYYFNDNGLLNIFLNNAETRLLENLVAVNLRSRFNEGVYYLKSQSIDADFFVEETGEVIQVAYSIDKISNDRETAALVKVSKTMKQAKYFTVITYDEEEELDTGGIHIKVIPIWKWLLAN